MNAETPPERGRRRTGTGRFESYTDHQTYMRQLDERIRWLDRHEHWWIRDVRHRKAEDVAA